MIFSLVAVLACTAPQSFRAPVAPASAHRLASHWTAPGSVCAVAGAGDVDADGYDDVVVGVTDGRGEVGVYLGSASGLGSTPAVTISAPSAGKEFGCAMDGAGDVDADGYDDIVVGEPGDSTVYLYLGGVGGVTSTSSWDSGSGSGWGLGRTVSKAGDVNGDGFADFVAGDPGLSSDAVEGCGKRTCLFVGQYVIWSGGVAGTVAEYTTGIGGRYDSVGYSLDDAGDLDGDGLDDVIVGAPGGPRGHAEGAGVIVEFGGDGAWQLELAARDRREGWAVAGPGDVDADGTPDLLIGAPGEGTYHAFLYGGVRGGVPRGVGSIAAADGRYVAAAGDVDGDGHADALLSVDSTSTSLFLGSSEGLTDSGLDLGGTAAVGPLGDIDADGLADFYVGSEVYLGAQLADLDGDGILGPVDCDDADPLTGGGTPEVCNGIDDNCDGTVDDTWLGVTMYPDRDGDGFGDPSGATLCEDGTPGRTYVPLGTDCDDTRASVHPRSYVEVRGDGVDSDCDGSDADGWS